jgi:uncharacterized protein
MKKQVKSSKTPQPVAESSDNVAQFRKPAITFTTPRTKPLSQITAADIPRGLSAYDVAIDGDGPVNADDWKVDPESFGGTDFPPLVTDEEERTITQFYAANPQLKSDPDSVDESILKMNPYESGTYRFNSEDAWIQTYSGRRFTPTNPNPDAIVIQDIAHSLSMQCRFSGHTKKFYSVAQHCVLVSHLCNFEDALWGLLHDASEAYLVDIPRPLKHSGQFDAYLNFEKVMQEAICKRFSLPMEEPVSVKRADKIMLATEARDLMSPLRADWTQPIDPVPFKIETLGPQDAKNLFMKRFFELTNMTDAYEHYLHYEANR